MTPRVPMPDPSDKEALRQWMRQIRNSRAHAPRSAPATPAEFAAVQRNRLLENVGYEPQLERRRLDVALTGAPTADHIVSVTTLGAFLTNLQESVSAVAQAITGRPTHYASIPRDIREATTLSAVATYPSSFGVSMYGPPIDTEYDLFGEPVGELRTVLNEAVDRVLDIADLSEGARSSSDVLTEQLAPLGQRAVKHIAALTSGLSSAGVGVRVSWQARAGEIRQSEWTPSGVKKVRDLCEHSAFSEAETVTIIGWLGAANSFKGKVVIRTDGGASINANTDEELTAQLDRHYNKRVEAEVEVTTAVFAGGRERKIYAIKSLRNLPQ